MRGGCLAAARRCAIAAGAALTTAALLAVAAQPVQPRAGGGATAWRNRIADRAFDAAPPPTAAAAARFPQSAQERSVDGDSFTAFRRFELQVVCPDSSSDSDSASASFPSHSSASCPCMARALELRGDMAAVFHAPGVAPPEQSSRMRHILRIVSEDWHTGDGRNGDKMNLENKTHDQMGFSMRSGAWWMDASRETASQQQGRDEWGSQSRPTTTTTTTTIDNKNNNNRARATQQQTAEAVVALMARIAPPDALDSRRWTAAALKNRLLCRSSPHFQAQDAFLVAMHLSERVTLPNGEQLEPGAWLLLALRQSSAELSQNGAPIVSCFYKEAFESYDTVSSTLGAPRPVVVELRQDARTDSTNHQSVSSPQAATTPSKISKGGTSVWAWLGIIPAVFAGVVIIAAISAMFLKSRKPREEPKPWPASPIASRRSNFLGEMQGTNISRPDVVTSA